MYRHCRYECCADQGACCGCCSVLEDNVNIDDIVEVLDDFYTRDEIDVWLASPNRLLNNQVPHDLIESGRGDEVLRQIRDGVYL